MIINKDEIQKAIESEINDGVKIYGLDFKIRLLKVMGLEKMLTPENNEHRSEIIALADWNKHYAYPTVRQLRQYYFQREENGFMYCVEYGGANGGRILINVNKFFEWHQHRSDKKKAM